MEYQAQLAELFEVIKRDGASDLHISAGRVPYVRVNGNLSPLASRAELTHEDMLGFLAEMVPPQKIQQLQSLHEIDFSHEYHDMRLRGNAYLHNGHISIALRALSEIRTLQELNLPPILEQFAKQKQGFFLVVGPVGQGKSTTLAAMIDYINTHREERIVTIENPIEYKYTAKNSIIEQRSVGTDTVDFGSGLKAAFRQDVNVILIGEMRGPETIAAAVSAAETGHLVFSTLHTNNAAQTIDRIVDSFDAEQQNQIRAQLAGSLIGIFSQRLIPTTDGTRVPAYEVLINNNATATLIREARTHELDTIIETSREEGMVDMNHSLAELVQAGRISIDEARKYSLHPEAFDQLF